MGGAQDIEQFWRQYFYCWGGGLGEGEIYRTNLEQYEHANAKKKNIRKQSGIGRLLNSRLRGLGCGRVVKLMGCETTVVASYSIKLQPSDSS